MAAAMSAVVVVHDVESVVVDVAKTCNPCIDDELDLLARKQYAFEAAIQKAIDDCPVAVHRLELRESGLVGRINVSMATNVAYDEDAADLAPAVVLYNGWTEKIGYCSNPSAFEPSSRRTADSYDTLCTTAYRMFDKATFRPSRDATGYYASQFGPIVFTLCVEPSYVQLLFSMENVDYQPSFATLAPPAP